MPRKIDPMAKAHFTRAVKRKILEIALSHGFADICDSVTVQGMISTMTSAMAARANRKESTDDF